MIMTKLKPSADSKTGRVWEIADEITRRSGRLARRQEVVDRYVAEGGNRNTASTQYHYWKSEAPRRQAMPGASLKVELQVGADGRVLIPQDVREAMDIGKDRTLVGRLENGVLRLMSPRMALRHLRELVRENDRGQGSAVDELIAERRSEVARP